MKRPLAAVIAGITVGILTTAILMAHDYRERKRIEQAIAERLAECNSAGEPVDQAYRIICSADKIRSLLDDGYTLAQLQGILAPASNRARDARE
jgi:hypothetical protein